MAVVGLSGFARAGKTEAANYLASRYGYTRKHIAEPLRAMLAVLLRANGLDDEMISRYLEGDLKDGVVIPELGVTSRQAQITLGTEWGRELISNDLWSNTWVRGLTPDSRVMNDSVRFPNEETAIRSHLDGITIMIVRPGTKPAKFTSWLGRKVYDWFGVLWGAHPSERVDLLNPDYTIINDGTIEDLQDKLDEIMFDQGLWEIKNSRAA